MISPRPIWQTFLLVAIAWAMSFVAHVTWPEEVQGSALALRVGLEMGGIALVVYSLGWGPTLLLGILFAAAHNIQMSGSRASVPSMVWLVVYALLGELAIASGLAPSLVRVPLVHDLAFLEVVAGLLLVFFLAQAAKEKEKVEADLREQEERFRALVHNSADIIIVTDEDGTITYASPALERITGVPVDDAIGRHGYELLAPVRDARIDRFEAEVAEGTGEFQRGELCLSPREGEHRWFDVRVTNLLENSAVHGVVANLRDVTERHVAEERLRHQASHDELTNLPNRPAFLDTVQRALDGSRGTDDLHAVLFLDVDRFKLVNDSLGHTTGDHLLVAVAERLRRCLRPGDLVARFGGDEFTVFLEGLAGTGDAITAAERIAEALRAPVRVLGHQLFVSGSVGIAVSSGGPEDASDLLRQADLAMYLAKERGRARWELYDVGQEPGVSARLEVEGDLWRAVGGDELEVFFQPEVDLDGAPRIIGVEALVRWRHPTRGLLPPAEFIPIAEESSLIVAVDRHVLERSCREAARWRKALQRDLIVSVNLSPRFLRQVDASGDVRNALAASGLHPRALQLEITERTAVADDEATVETLRELRGLGVRVAIDDFGTGYSTLDYLKRLPVDVLKLDRSFVSGLDDTAEDAAIVQAVITMGHAMGLHITAEGVERREQAAQLRLLGCDAAQGFHFAHPVPAPELEEMLRRGAVDARDAAPVGEHPDGTAAGG